MKRLASIGECMLEFSALEGDLFTRSFAGDTYNFALYFNRVVGTVFQTEYVTALGDDPVTEKMLAAFQSESIGVDCVRRLPGRLPGLYLVQTDDQGERSFYFYRSESAARDLFIGDEGRQLAESLLAFDVLYFSGITLGMLHQSSRDRLIQLLSDASAKGITICFDNNYRAALWSSAEEARAIYESIYPFVDIALPSFEDSQAIYDDDRMETTADRLLSYGVSECVITSGANGCLLSSKSDRNFISIEPVENVVDTTSAGDSFNGGYLAKRLLGATMVESAQFGATLAARVIQYKGAIISLDEMADLII